MDFITEKEIINHIQERVNFHHREHLRFKQVLTAFIADSTEADSHQTPSARIADNLISTSSSTSLSGNDLPQSLRSKAHLALTSIGKGFKEDVAAEMIRVEPEIAGPALLKRLSVALSALKISGKLRAVKVGRKDQYSLPN
jgi:response regulator of citrate/malate metabolism